MFQVLPTDQMNRVADLLEEASLNLYMLKIWVYEET